MKLNQAQFNAVVEDAKAAAANFPRWIQAIDNAVAGVVSGWWIVTELQNSVVITTERGETYFAARGRCQCEAFKRNQPCKHRAAARLIERYNAASGAERVLEA
jgi:hypothetical protein